MNIYIYIIYIYICIYTHTFYIHVYIYICYVANITNIANKDANLILNTRNFVDPKKNRSNAKPQFRLGGI